MNPFHSATVAISVALMVSLGSASAATTSVPSPSLSTLTDSRTLDLRATGSQLVVKTIEDTLRQGGLALLGEGFQLDSSVRWVFGETVEGEADAVVPLWSRGGHVVFAQPGFVFWPGLEEEERMDGNFGVVYRTGTANGVVTGASLFYDHDFQIGHSRLGFGVDAQKEGFYGAFNYYHPLSDTQDGREGYVEDALRGMDLSLAVESDVTRFGGNVGYWKFQGEDDVKDSWELSYGIDAGIRIIPGIFLEGKLQRHDKDASLGQRASAGLAFRFSLPDFKGKSYGSGEGASSLYKIVEREKRILYEEREAGPKVSIVRGGDVAGDIMEGDMVELDIRLNEALEEDVALNFIGSGSATYGTDGDWTMSVGDTACPQVTEDNCGVMISAGDTVASDNVTVAILDDLRTGEGAETIILSVEIASAGNTGLTPAGPLVLTIPPDSPLPSFSLSATSTEIAENGRVTLNIELSEEVSDPVTISLVAGGDADYGTSADWHLNNGTNCNSAGEGDCQITIAAGDRFPRATLTVNDDASTEEEETFTVSIVVDSGSRHLVQEGDDSSLLFTIPANTANSVRFTTATLAVTEGGSITAPAGENRFAFPEVVLSSPLPAGIELTLVITGTAEDGDYGIMAALNQRNSNGAAYDSDTQVWTLPSEVTDPILVFESTQERSNPDTDDETVIIELTDPNNNLPTGWSIAEPSTITITIVDEG